MVCPAEIEAVLLRHPKVSRCAVVGVPDARWGEAGKAVVVPVAGVQSSSDELRAFLHQQLASYKIPKRVGLRDALPLTAAGKVDRRALA